MINEAGHTIWWSNIVVDRLLYCCYGAQRTRCRCALIDHLCAHVSDSMTYMFIRSGMHQSISSGMIRFANR